MSTRKGKIVVLEEVLDEAVGRALQIIEHKKIRTSLTNSAWLNKSEWGPSFSGI